LLTITQNRPGCQPDGLANILGDVSLATSLASTQDQVNMSAGDLAQSGRTILLIGLDRVIGRIATVANEVGEQFPYCADRYGKWKTTSDGDWCGGHWVGMLWIAYRRTGEPR